MSALCSKSIIALLHLANKSNIVFAASVTYQWNSTTNMETSKYKLPGMILNRLDLIVTKLADDVSWWFGIPLN